MDATRPATSAMQSNIMWKESEMRPRLLLSTPYTSSTSAKLKLMIRKKNRLRVSRSVKTALEPHVRSIVMVRV